MTQSDSDELLRSRCFDLWEQYTRRGRTGFLGFLTPFEAEELSACLPPDARKQLHFWGGYPEAERVMLTFSDSADPDDFPIVLLLVTWRKDETLTHRDLLGALMGEGVRRECVGDILLQEGAAVFFARAQMAEVFRSLRSVGRSTVTVREIDTLPAGFEQHTEERRASVASLRLDCIVGCVARLARGRAEEAISQKLVSVNGRTETRPDRKLNLPATVSVRGVGKFKLLELAGETRKGRLILNYEVFL